ncbi:hypothetical protein Hosp_058 [Mycobacterium phage Hosp]|uniref:hypothetical protein n=1 Tax=Mycobacterium phage Hosp TaxID=1463811 RepID=UPI00042EE2F0|nr:hypothetical protein FH38_gp58 [Mycobacterium phage Hosp]AHK12012.1 hypothetical protein Hosp_058 [Mycobacterium phage Hosp]
MTTNKRSETLAEFSRLIDDHLGKPVGFAEAVKALADVKARISAVEERRKTAHDALKQIFATEADGGLLVVPVGGGQRKVLFEQTNRPTIKKAVSAAAAKEAGVWEKARVIRRQVAVTAPKGTPISGELPKLPPVPMPYMNIEQIHGLYEHPAYAVLKELREELGDATNALDKVAAEAGWDGEPYSFKDGWKVGLTLAAYNSDRLKAVDPETWERLAVVTEVSGGTRLKYMDLDQAVSLGLVDYDDVELDEIQGD